MTWTTTDYRIEECAIKQSEGCYRDVWFLDAVQVDEAGRTSTSNICSGTEDYCRKTLCEILNPTGD